MEIFCNNVKVYNATSELNVSLLNKSINFFQKRKYHRNMQRLKNKMFYYKTNIFPI